MSDEHFAANLANDLGAAVRSNPLPAALIGMGLVWLFSGRAPVKTGLSGAVDGVANMGSRAGERVRDLSQTIGQTIGAAAKSVGQSAGEAMTRKSPAAVSSPGDAGAAQASDLASVRANVADLIQRQPMVFGAIGILIGAGIAAALPPTDLEADALGESSANLRQAARDLASEATRRAAVVADGVTTTIAEEARVEGLTLDGVREGANEASRRVDRFVHESAERLRARMN